MMQKEKNFQHAKLAELNAWKCLLYPTENIINKRIWSTKLFHQTPVSGKSLINLKRMGQASFTSSTTLHGNFVQGDVTYVHNIMWYWLILGKKKCGKSGSPRGRPRMWIEGLSIQAQGDHRGPQSINTLGLFLISAGVD